ncbi:MAG TPA: alternative ribosome rescue aminoacyl-tRNA hydrolase ArfB, partial [Nitriliruptorales bacterium]
SGGPGGQGVNTTASKVELRWDMESSDALAEWQKQLVRERLGGRLTGDGVLILQASEERSQHQNRETARARFQALLKEAIRPPRKRRQTGVSASQKRRRLEDKAHRARVKELRRDPEPPPG